MRVRMEIFPVIELLLSQGHKDIEIGFEGACRGGKFEIPEWMVKLGAQNLINGFKIAYFSQWDVCVWIWKLIFEKTSGIEWENRHYFFSCNSSSYDHTANQLPSKLKLNYPNAFIENFNYIPNLSIWQGNLELLQMFGELHEYVNYKHNLQSTIFCSFSNVKTNRRTHMQQFKALYCFAKMKKIFVDFGKLYEEIHDAIQPFFRSLFDKKYMILIQLTLKHQPFFLFGIINEFGFLPGILGDCTIDQISGQSSAQSPRCKRPGSCCADNKGTSLRRENQSSHGADHRYL